MEDTICAIATTVGNSGINVIRVSGSNSISIVNNIFDKNLLKKESHTVTYGHIIDNNEIIDEVLVSVFKSPKTFTREDIVEISTHGGSISVNKTLEILLNNGCRLAEPGEFLKRAYLNGRIDLTEAEAVSDLIEAKTDNARKQAIKGINKELKEIINNLRSKIVSLIGNIEVNIDYPEYEDAEVITIEKVSEVLKDVYKTVERLVKDSDKGLIIKNGINIAIVGKPNVGKSSILNMLANTDKAIVTDIEGTTRDIVEATVVIDGIIVNLFDTAGIRDTEDVVEKIGVKRSIETIDNADLILFVLDSSKEFTSEDKLILDKVKDKNVLVVFNKSDLEQIIDIDIPNIDNISISTKNGSLAKEELKRKISSIFKLNEIESDYTYISNSRQISLLKKCKKISENIEESIKNQLPIDMVEIDVKELWDTLGEITGETYEEELLDEIFSRFCLGK